MTRVAVLGDELGRVREALEAAGLEPVRSDPELVLCHGGDGSLLRAERTWPGVPKCPVRVASRTRACAEHTLEAVLERLVGGRLVTEVLPKLRIEIGSTRLAALNEATLRNAVPSSALRFAVHGAGLPEEEIIGDGLVVATPFGSSGYFRSISGRTLDDGLGVAFNNTTRAHAPVVLPADKVLAIEVIRGPALLVRDNDIRTVVLREGHTFQVSIAGDSAQVLGLDTLRCSRCRRADGQRFNPHGDHAG